MAIKPRQITLKRSSRLQGWMPTFSGSGFHPISPKVSDVCLEDITRGLAYKFRYGGHTEPITVAEHSILVSRVIEILWPQSGQMLAGLLHDACEAYTHDIQAPIRRFIKVEKPDGTFVSWGDMEREINQVIAKALGINQDFYQSPEVKAADILTLTIEKAQIPALQQYGNWGLPKIPDELSDVKVAHLSSEESYHAFRKRYRELTPSEE